MVTNVGGNMNRLYVIISLIYFLALCWVISIFPQALVVAIDSNEKISNLVSLVLPLAVAVFFLNKFRKNWKKGISPDNNDIPLFEIYPALENKLLQLANSLNIRQKIIFYVNDYKGINAKAKGNKEYALVTLSEGLLKLEQHDIEAILLHELFHVKNWTIHYINFELAMMLEEINLTVRKFHEKQKRKILYRYFQIDYFLYVLNFFTVIILLFLNTISNIFRMIIDETLADKFSIDMHKSLRIITVLKKSEKMNNRFVAFENDFRFSQHLHVDIRCWLLSKYHYFKYVRPKWNVIRNIFMVLSLVLVILYFYSMPLILEYINVCIANGFKKLELFWIDLFNQNDQLAKTTFFLLTLSAAFIWCFIKLIRIWLLGGNWAVRLQYISYLSFLSIIITVLINSFVILPQKFILGNVAFFVISFFLSSKQ